VKNIMHVSALINSDSCRLLASRGPAIIPPIFRRCAKPLSALLYRLCKRLHHSDAAPLA
jgi:hypothetical protein